MHLVGEVARLQAAALFHEGQARALLSNLSAMAAISPSRGAVR
jgi:hypothetical protein